MAVYKKKSAVASYPAFDVVRRSERDITIPIYREFELDRMENYRVTEVTNGERFVLSDHLTKYRFGSVVGIAIENNEDPIFAYRRAIHLGHKTHFISEVASVISNTPSATDEVLELKVGSIIRFEGVIFEITRTRNGLSLLPIV